MNAIPVKPCKHEACGCKVEDDKTWCSPQCSRQETDGDGKCSCGHSDCIVEAALERKSQN